jgi:sugar transferase (PEP-CTERM system associated)
MLPGTERVLPALIVAILIYLLALVLVRMLCAGFVYPRAFRRRILVLGAGPIAAKVQGLMHTGAAQHLDIVGFVPLAQERARPHVTKVLAEHEFADHEGLAAFVEANDIDELVVATSERRGLPVYDLLGCKLDGRKVTDFLSFWEREAQCVDLDELQPSWLIFSDGFDISLTRLALKRAFDVVVSLVMLTATLPVTLLCALAIKFDSPGPVFYRQTRVGLDGTPFDVLKFRSMRVDAEKDGRPRWASQADDRITRVGRFVRQTRIDELPQIINVLKGEMSFVGPRPERPFFVAELAEKIPFYNERHRVKPGITGWAQINYPYGASEEDARAKLSYDLYYIKNGSLFLDLVILFQTVRVVLWPDGAR